MDTQLTWLAAVFLGPSIVTAAVWMLGAWNGKKTTINLSLATIIAGAKGLDFSFMPQDISTALLAGLGVAGILSNTVFTERGKAD